MSQKITVECQHCEGVESYETESAIMILVMKDAPNRFRLVTHDVDPDDLLVAAGRLIEDYLEAKEHRDKEPA